MTVVVDGGCLCTCRALLIVHAQCMSVAGGDIKHPSRNHVMAKEDDYKVAHVELVCSDMVYAAPMALSVAQLFLRFVAWLALHMMFNITIHLIASIYKTEFYNAKLASWRLDLKPPL